MKEIINITSLSVVSGATVVQASLDTQDFVLSETIALFTEQGLPVAIVGATKVSGSDYELTLKKPWPYADQTGVKGLLLPTTVDLREVTRQVSKQNDAFTGWFTKMDIWLNEMGTVEVQGPSGATQIETLPQMTYQIQQNAEQVQADLELIGDAPMYAQNAKDEADRAAAKALEASNSATAARNSEINSADSEGNSAASASLASSKATAASNSAAAASDSQVAAKDSQTASLASENKSQKWAQEAHNVQVETGLYSAYHWSVESKASADAASSSETNAKEYETNSASSEQAAKQSETTANQHRLEALSWATEAVDVEVTTGKYSAYHYSVKASESEQKAAASEQVATQKASSASSDANLAEKHKQNAASHSLDAADSKNLAKKWAEEAYGVEVLTGEYSAYHWSVDSKSSANAAKDSEIAAANSEQIASQKASEASDSESTATLKAGESADSAAAASNSESLAEQHKLKAKEWSEKDVDIEVETGLYSSRHHATKSAGSAAEALQSEQTAGQHKSDASSFMSQAQSHMNKAMQWAEEADGVEVETGKYSSKHWSSISKGYSEEAKQAAQALTGGMYMGGQWDASTGQVPPAPDVGSVFYKIVNSGTILGVNYAPGDSIIYNPQNDEWFKQDGSDKVDSVNGYVGSINLTYSDVNALPDTWTPSWSQVKNKPATATRWPTLSEIGAKAEGWTPSWSEVTGKPATATRWPSFSEVTGVPETATRWPTISEIGAKSESWTPSWSEVTGKPSKFEPKPHSHPYLPISGGTLSGYFGVSVSSGELPGVGYALARLHRTGYDGTPNAAAGLALTASNGKGNILGGGEEKLIIDSYDGTTNNRLLEIINSTKDAEFFGDVKCKQLRITDNFYGVGVVSFLEEGAALPINTNNLLVSNSYSDRSQVPEDGAYVKGSVISGNNFVAKGGQGARFGGSSRVENGAYISGLERGTHLYTGSKATGSPLWREGSTYYKIYHEGHKPTPGEIGAVPGSSSKISGSGASGWGSINVDGISGGYVGFRFLDAPNCHFMIRASDSYSGVHFDGSWSWAFNGNGTLSSGNVPWNRVSSKPSLMGLDTSGSYDGMKNADGSTSAWIRTTSNGILPKTSGGDSSLGTSSWPFQKIYGNNIYDNGTLLENKYAAKSHSHNYLSFGGSDFSGRYPVCVKVSGERIYSNNGIEFDGSNNGLYVSGNVTAYASDERLKKNVVRIPDALRKIDLLNGVTFDWRDNCEELGFKPSMRRETGFIAQNVQKVIPDAVAPAPFDNEYLTVHKEKITALLVEALKEEKSEREKLEDRLEKLEKLLEVK